MAFMARSKWASKSSIRRERVVTPKRGVGRDRTLTRIGLFLRTEALCLFLELMPRNNSPRYEKSDYGQRCGANTTADQQWLAYTKEGSPIVPVNSLPVQFS